MAKTVLAFCHRCGKDFQAPAWAQAIPEKFKKYCGRKCGVNRHPPILIRFWDKVKIDHATGCWLWTGTKNNWGYPIFYESGKVLLGHKWAFKFFVGPVPEGKILMHSCDNPSCANPCHLTIGTLTDNSQDMIRKGRARWQKEAS